MAVALADESSFVLDDFEHSEGSPSPQVQSSGQEEGLRLAAALYTRFSTDFPALLGRTPNEVAAVDAEPNSPKAPMPLEPDLVMLLGLVLAKIEAVDQGQQVLLQHFEQLDEVKNGSPLSGDAASRSGSKHTVAEQNTRSHRSRVQHTHNGAPLTLRKQLWRFLEHRSSSRLARWYSHMMFCLIAIGAANYWSVLLEYADFSPGLAMFQQVFFAVELVVRFAACPARAAFLCNFYNWVDLITTLVQVPVILMAFGGQDVDHFDPLLFNVFCPVLMMLKLLRRFQTFHLLLTAFKEASQSLPLLLYTVFVIGSFFAAVIYSVEPRSNVTSFGHAAWLVIVTMSTVGYGDVSASTKSGYIASSFMIVISSLYIAVPIGIVGNSFSTVWNDRHRLMMLQYIRDYIGWAGLSLGEVQQMLDSVDRDGDARLTFDEFKWVLPMLKVTLSDQAALDLFHSIDKLEEGVIDYSTFLGAVFPGHNAQATLYKQKIIETGRKSRFGKQSRSH